MFYSCQPRMRYHAKFIDLDEKAILIFPWFNFWSKSVLSLMHKSGPQWGGTGGQLQAWTQSRSRRQERNQEKKQSYPKEDI